MLTTHNNLDSLLRENVCDVRVARRIPLSNKPPTRRMLCTKSFDLLSSANGKIVLNYKQPKGSKQFNESLKNALVVWDILMQDYRVVSTERVDLLNTYPVGDQFWDFFNREIYPMTTQQKIAFMES